MRFYKNNSVENLETVANDNEERADCNIYIQYTFLVCLLLIADRLFADLGVAIT